VSRPEIVGRVLAIHRFPVKGLAGERIPVVRIGRNGLRGDRTWYLRDRRSGMRITAQRTPGLLAFRARWLEAEPSGLPRVRVLTPHGEEWDVPSGRLLEELRRVSVPGADWAHAPEGKFEDAPIQILSVATVREIERAWGHPLDYRRFRPSIYVETVSGLPFAEEEWIERRLRCGTAEWEVVGATQLSTTVALDPETQAADSSLPALLQKLRRGRAGIGARSITPGTVREGDTISLREK
jgi:MOSC domain-containing protein